MRVVVNWDLVFNLGDCGVALRFFGVCALLRHQNLIFDGCISEDGDVFAA